jgi:hypothetical protein
MVSAEVHVHQTGDLLLRIGIPIVMKSLDQGRSAVPDPDDGNPDLPVAQERAPFYAVRPEWDSGCLTFELEGLFLRLREKAWTMGGFVEPCSGGHARRHYLDHS